MLEQDLRPGVMIEVNRRLSTGESSYQPSEVSEEAQEITISLKGVRLGKGKNARVVDITRRIIYLPYYEGKINYVETDTAVLSGPFTGCFMPVYQVDDKRRVAHVHTGTNADCKGLMSDLLEQENYQLINCFKPFNRFDVNFRLKRLMQNSGASSAYAFFAFGLVTSQNSFYSIYVERISATSGSPLYKVCQVCNHTQRFEYPTVSENRQAMMAKRRAAVDRSNYTPHTI